MNKLRQIIGMMGSMMMTGANYTNLCNPSSLLRQGLLGVARYSARCCPTFPAPGDPSREGEPLPKDNQ